MLPDKAELEASGHRIVAAMTNCRKEMRELLSDVQDYQGHKLIIDNNTKLQRQLGKDFFTGKDKTAYMAEMESHMRQMEALEPAFRRFEYLKSTLDSLERQLSFIQTTLRTP